MSIPMSFAPHKARAPGRNVVVLAIRWILGGQ